MKFTYLVAAVMLFLAVSMSTASAHSFFEAELTGDFAASLSGYTHTGLFYYNLTSSDTLSRPVNATLIKGDPNGDFETVLVLTGPLSPNSTDVMAPLPGEDEPDPPAYGYFSREDSEIEFPDVYGDIYDIFQEACKGELFVVVESRNGTSAGPLTYRPPAATNGPVKTCEEAAQPYKAAAASVPAPAPAVSSSVRAVASVGALAAAAAALVV